MRMRPKFGKTASAGHLFPNRLLSMCCLLLSGVVLESAAQSGHLTSLCELFQNHEKYNGKMVTIRGVLNASIHGTVLVNRQCSQQSRYKPFERGAAINLETPGGEVEPNVPIPNFEIDQRSERLFLELVDKKQAKGESIIVTLTCTGLIRSAEDFRLEEASGRAYRGNGFGHMGIYPAELVIKSIKDAEIKNVSN
jgi:hypothetical protein